jgi:hypothetical protein
MPTTFDAPPLTGQPPMAMIPATRMGADGCVPFAPESDEIGCCPPPLCGNDLCCTFVAFFNLLPSGPLWDYWKGKAISYFESNEDPALCPLLTDPNCPSIVLHSIYTVLKLRTMVHGALWTALRESNPVTAIVTLDDYLARLRWEDCHNQHCRSVLLGALTPYEVMGDCGPLFCPPSFPPELTEAVKRNVAIALTRANMGVIKNLCSINWIIEPLGAELRPVITPEPDPPIAKEKCASLCAPDITFEICNTRDWLEGHGSGDVCDTHSPLPQVPAYWDRECDRPAGLPDRIWPAVLSAECIVRSLLNPSCPVTIIRCC